MGYSHVLTAAKRLVNLDDKQVDAVATRIELDLRIGYAFTRFITNSLRPLGGPMSTLMISYGECHDLPVDLYLWLTMKFQALVSSRPSASSWTATSK